MNRLGERVDFIGVGVQKAATDWLFACMAEHPQLRVSSVKEVNFFNKNYEKGFLWYHRFFQFGALQAGEYSPLYFQCKDVPERIHRYNPDAKLVLSLRNPVDRAYSQHKHQIMRNRLPPHLHDFARAMEQNPSYIEQGKYATHLENYLSFFGRERIHVVLFEEVASRPKDVLRELFGYLGVERSFEPSVLGKRLNVARTYKSRRLHRLMGKGGRTFRRLLGQAPVQLIKSAGLTGVLRNWNEVELKGDLMPLMTKEAGESLRTLFEDEIRRLELLIGRDLSLWRRPRDASS